MDIQLLKRLEKVTSQISKYFNIKAGPFKSPAFSFV